MQLGRLATRQLGSSAAWRLGSFTFGVLGSSAVIACQLPGRELGILQLGSLADGQLVSSATWQLGSLTFWFTYRQLAAWQRRLLGGSYGSGRGNGGRACSKLRILPDTKPSIALRQVEASVPLPKKVFKQAMSYHECSSSRDGFLVVRRLLHEL